MILDKEILQAVAQHCQKMRMPVHLILGAGEHSGQASLRQFLQQLATTSPLIVFDPELSDESLSPLSFKLSTEKSSSIKQDTGIVFSGIPGGHEFSSLILALLQAGGHALKLDSDIQTLVQAITVPLSLQTFVSLSCHNCPEVVQALNQFALLNEQITHETIDGAMFPELIERHNIQGVPCVLLNGKVFLNGKVDTSALVQKLQEVYLDTDASRPQMVAQPRDVTVIGGGPAGVAAAIYAARKGKSVCLVADRMGGQVKDTQAIENFIATPLTYGDKLAGQLLTHIQSYAIDVKEYVRVTSVTKSGDGYEVELNTGLKWRSRTLIVATGATWRKLGVAGEESNVGRGVAYCPHCDGPFFKGKAVAVVGGGNSGIEAALDLSGIVRHVTVLEMSDEWRADQVLLEKVASTSNIRLIKNAVTREITAENNKVNALIYHDSNSQEQYTLPVAAVFVQIGLVPNSQIFQALLETTPSGEIKIDAHCRTNLPGIFACGDVTTVPFKQINIAIGEGSKAALSAFEYLMLQK